MHGTSREQAALNVGMDVDDYLRANVSIKSNQQMSDEMDTCISTTRLWLRQIGLTKRLQVMTEEAAK